MKPLEISFFLPENEDVILPISMLINLIIIHHLKIGKK
jgi:hypothetical protein